MTHKEIAPWPVFGEDEIEAVTKVLRSGKVSQWTGSEVTDFEKEFAQYCQTKYAVALANGTVAIELALRALGVGQGDEVIVTSRSFVASASSIVLVGATPVFADCDLNTQGLSGESIENELTTKTKAVVLVHLGGHPCDMDPIMALAKEKGLYIIEDCSQAHGAKYKGHPVGSIGHIGTWSFCQDKIMTTGGEGGMLTCNDENIWRYSWSFKDHGKNHDSVHSKEHPIGFRWLHDSFGTNWRLTEIQAAIGRVMLRKVDQWVERRSYLAGCFDSVLGELDCIRIIKKDLDFKNAYYKYYCFLEPNKLKKGWTRDRILDEMSSEGHHVFSGSCSEIYLEKSFTKSGLQPRSLLRNAKQLGETSLMFQVHPNRTDSEVKDAALALKKILLEASIATISTPGEDYSQAALI